MTGSRGAGDREQSSKLPGPQLLTALAKVHHHVWADGGELVGVEFEFAEGVVLVQIELDTDEVLVSFLDELTVRCALNVSEVDEVMRVDVSDRPVYQRLIGSDSCWRWSLVNQQGYQDAVQIEFRVQDATDAVSLQYLAIAGLLRVRSLTTA